MTKEEINVAIAEACGWKPKDSWILHGRIKKEFHFEHSVTGERSFSFPNYHDDLNAAIRLVDGMKVTIYRNPHGEYGWSVLIKPSAFHEYYGNHPDNLCYAICEAFLKTIGKWKDTH